MSEAGPAARGMLIMASAGSGKTFALTSRVIALLLRGVEPSRVLATTFTRKAAGEVLDRILLRLCRGATDESSAARLSKEVGVPATAAECSAVLRRVVDELPRLRVMTIDAFFLRLAGAFAMELPAPPGWRLSRDEQERRVADEALGAVLDGTTMRTLLRLMQSLSRAGTPRGVRENLQSAVDIALSAWRRGGERIEPWRVVPGPAVRLLKAEDLKSTIEQLRRAPLPMTGKGTANKNVAKALDRVIQCATNEDWTGLAEERICRAAIDGEPFSRVELDDGLARPLGALAIHAAAVLLHRLRARNVAAAELAARYERALTRTRRRTGLYAFDDVPRLLRGAGRVTLRRAGAITDAADAAQVRREGLDLHEIAYRLDGSVDHLLLDEFQDTSLTQLQLFTPMIEEILSGGDRERSVFVVGDLKQSLYQWREAEPGLMEALPERFAGFATSSLSKNWRSGAEVLSAVNTVFAGLGGNGALAGNAAAMEAGKAFAAGFDRHVGAGRAQDAGAVRVWASPMGMAGSNGRVSASEARAAACARAAERVAALLEEPGVGDVAVLVRTGKPIARLTYELRRRGIASSQEGGNPLTDSPGVRAALSVLRFADHPGDEQSWFHATQTAVGAAAGIRHEDGLWRSRARASAVRERIERIGLAEVLDEWLRGAAGEMDHRGVARFGQLIALARAFDDESARGPMDLSRFVTMAEGHRAEDPGAQRVRVMTIHASKGLEFDAVVLPDMDGAWRLRNDDLLTDRPSPMEATTAISHSTSEKIRAYDPMLESLHTATMRRTVHAELCCVYVALTRAKKVLEMIVAPKSGAEDGADGDDAGGHGDAGSDDGAPAKLSLSAAGVVVGALAPGSALRAGELVFSSGREPQEASAGGAAADQRPPTAEPAHVTRAATGDGAVVATRVAAVAGTTDAGEGVVSARHLPRASPSGMEGGSLVDVSLLLRPVSSAGRDKGTAMHAFFECVAWLEDGEPDDATLVRAATGAGADERLVRGLIPEFRAALGSAIGAALRRDRYGPAAGARLELLREQRFSVVDRQPGGPPSLLNGAIDRLVVRVDAKGRAIEAEVLDYKTDAIGTGGVADEQRLAQRVEHYTPQVRAYKRAAAALLGLGVSKIRGVLLFTGTGRLVTIEGA